MDRIADYVALAVAIHGVALIVVNLTPTPKDTKKNRQTCGQAL
jgi:hypothetical protein